MPLDPRADENRQIDHVRDDLVREFPAVPRTVVEQQVVQVALSFRQARVRTFVPVLVRRGARERLRHLA